MAIPAPTIYPSLRNGERIKDDAVDEATIFNITCNGLNNQLLNIYFTINGAKPNPSDRRADRATLLYKQPFTLSKGKYQFKALAERKGSRTGATSSTTTKWYEVQVAKQRRSSLDNDADDLYFGSPLKDLSDVECAISVTDESLFNPDEYLETRQRYKDKKKLEQLGDACELCKTPRPGPEAIVCNMCGYKLPDLSSREIQQARELAQQLTDFNNHHEQAPRYITVNVSPTKKTSSPNRTRHHNTTTRDTLQHTTTANTTVRQQRSPSPTKADGPLTKLLHTMNTMNTTKRKHNRNRGSTDGEDDGSDDGDGNDDSDGSVVAQATKRIVNILSKSHEELPQILKTEARNHFQQTNVRQTPGRQTQTLPFKWCDQCEKPNAADLDECATCFASLHQHPLMQPPEPTSHTPTSKKPQFQFQSTKPRSRNETRLEQPLEETTFVQGPKGGAVCVNCNTECATDCRFCYWCGFQFEWKVGEKKKEEKQKQLLKKKNQAEEAAKVNYVTLPGGELVKMITDGKTKYEADGTPAVEWTIDPLSLAKVSKVQKKFKNSKTQTEILYFRQIEESRARDELAKTKRANSKPPYRERNPVVADVSPGNGYWRQQLDHVLMKLKAFARNSPSVQAAAGKYRMGDVTNAQIRQDGDQVLVTISLDDMQVAGTVAGTGTKKKVVDDVVYSSRQKIQATQTTAEDFKQVKRLTRTQSTSSTTATAKATVSDLTKLLFSELGAEGGGDSKVILGLLDEGANVNAFGVHGSKERDRDRPLHVAARYGRVEAIKFLITAGASVNDRGSKGDTALHSAIRGNDKSATACIALLLKNGGDAEMQNMETLSPCALAAELGFQKLVNFLGKQISNSTLSSLMKPRLKK